jgi:hypothetical protein
LKAADCRLEVPDWRLEPSEARLELSDARLEVSDYRLEVLDCRLEPRDARLELSEARLEPPDARLKSVDVRLKQGGLHERTGLDTKKRARSRRFMPKMGGGAGGFRQGPVDGKLIDVQFVLILVDFKSHTAGRVAFALNVEADGSHEKGQRIRGKHRRDVEPGVSRDDYRAPKFHNFMPPVYPGMLKIIPIGKRGFV